MARLLICLAFAATAAEASAQTRILGLLSLPEVFGRGGCDRYTPEAVPLYREPGDKLSIGSIQVEKEWSFAPHGGCEGLEVRVRRGREVSQLPVREYDYEAPAAIVVEQRGPWFRIRLDGDTAWVYASSPDRFMPLSQLFEEFVGVTSIAGNAGRLVSKPGGSSTIEIGPQLEAGRAVRVIEMRTVRDQPWIQVEALSHSACAAGEHGPPEVIATGWLRLYSSNGEPTVWFSSRGC